MIPVSKAVYPKYAVTSCDLIVHNMYRFSEGIWMHCGDDYLVAGLHEALSGFSHLDFSDNLPSLCTTGLFLRTFFKVQKFG